MEFWAHDFCKRTWSQWQRVWQHPAQEIVTPSLLYAPAEVSGDQATPICISGLWPGGR